MHIVDEESEVASNVDISTIVSKRDIRKNLEEGPRNIFTLQMNKKNIKVKSLTIDTLVRRYAISVFNEFELDLKKDK